MKPIHLIQQFSSFVPNQNLLTLYPRLTKSFFSRANNKFQSSGFKNGYFFLCYIIFNSLLLGVWKWSLVLEILLSCPAFKLVCQEDMNSIQSTKLTTVFVDTRLWITKHPRKRFQNFRQSCVLLTERIEIHQLQPLV